VRHVVELHGGSVSAESEGVERGSTFTVKLPLRPDSVPVRDPASRATLDSDPNLPMMRLDGLKVLVVDDEFDAREMIATLLQVAGAEVAVVDSPVEALERLATFAADVLVSDVGMPGDDGYTLIRRIRGSGARYARIPALALTAYAAPEDARRAALAGFHAHLPKPAEPTVLTALVASLGGRGEYFVTSSTAPPSSSSREGS
jgi:CheY-like chemotaxis protein